jgi:type-F conjugative transfer system pilin assembly protein TrbC
LEEKKLLFFVKIPVTRVFMALICLIVVFMANIFTSHANDNIAPTFQEPTKQDYESATDLLNNSQHTMLQSLTQGKSSTEPNFYIFISFSLSKQNLAEMMSFAKNYQGQLVLRGLKNNSFKQTTAYLQEIGLTGEESGVMIDPVLFDTYKITEVPSYVLSNSELCPPNISCKPIYDKLTGNVTAKFALEKFAKSGDLMDEAGFILELAREN